MPAQAEGDPTRVRQILMNLVGNAIKFTEIGEVRLRVQLRDEPAPPTLCFEVVDTGIGITAAERGKLFRPFGQADSSTTRRYGGTGLGLTISKRLTDLLDGAITVESEPGHGTTFRVELPAGNLYGVERVPALAANRDAVEPEPGRGAAELSGRVLLVEDGPDNQRLISLLLAPGRPRGRDRRERPAGGRARARGAAGGNALPADPHGHADARDGRLHRDAYPAPPGLRRVDRRADRPRAWTRSAGAACRRAATTSRPSR